MASLAMRQLLWWVCLEAVVLGDIEAQAAASAEPLPVGLATGPVEDYALSAGEQVTTPVAHERDLVLRAETLCGAVDLPWVSAHEGHAAVGADRSPALGAFDRLRRLRFCL